MTFYTHTLDPVIFSLGPLSLRWYGLMYVIGFTLGGWLLRRLAQQRFLQVPPEEVERYVTWLIVGMLIGARLVYATIYNWDETVEAPWEIFFIWQGGLSFHGAVLGMIVATWAFARKFKIPFLQVSDALALAGTQGLFWGRLGNFINGELFGRHAEVPWAIIFPSGGPLPRHPSQLYEAIGEGILLFLLIWLVKKRFRRYGLCSFTFVVGYGTIRFAIEFFRMPDEQLGFYWGAFSMGQILCLLMMLGGIPIAWALKGLAIVPPDDRMPAPAGPLGLAPLKKGENR